MSPDLDAEGLVPGYETKTIFDAPVLTLSRVLDGNVDFDVLRRIWLEPSEDLSPAERQAFTDRIKKAVGGHAATDAFVDILSNPMTWLLFLTQPAAGTAIKASLRATSGASARLFATDGMSGIVKFARNNFSILNKLGLLGPDAMLMGTPLGAMIRRVAHLKQAFRRRQEEVVSGPIREYLDDLGRRHGQKITRFDPSEARGAARDEMERDMRLLAAVTSGLDGNLKLVDEVPSRVVRQKLKLNTEGLGRHETTEYYMTDEDAARLHRAASMPQNAGKPLKEWEIPPRSGSTSTVPEEASRLQFFRKDKETGAIERRLFEDWGTTSVESVTPISNSEDVGFTAIGSRPKSPVGSRGGRIQATIARDPSKDKLKGVLDAYRRYQQDVEVLVHGDEQFYKETGRYRPDESKVLRLMSLEAKARRKDAPSIIGEIIEGEARGRESRWFGDEGILKILRGDANAARREVFKKKLMGLFQERFGYIGDGKAGAPSLTVQRPGMATEYVDATNRVVDDVGLKEVLKDPRSQLHKGVEEVPTTWNRDDLLNLKADLDSINVQYDPQWFDDALRESDDAARELVRGGATTSFRKVRRLDFQRMVGSFDHRAFRQHVGTSSLNDGDFNVYESIMDNPWKDYAPGGQAARLNMAPRTLRSRMSIESEPDMISSLGSLSDRQELYSTARVEPPGGFSLIDMIETTTEAIREGRPEVADFVEAVLLPRVFDEMPMRNMLTMSMILKTKEAGRWLAGSGFGKAIGDMHPRARELMDHLREWSEQPVRQVDAGKLLGGGASWLYSSHMGLNVPSVILNLTQPFLNAGSWLGYQEVLASYGDAFKSLGRYYDWRLSKAGQAATFAQRNEKIRELLDPDDLMGLTDDVLDSIEDPFRTSGQHKGRIRTILDMTMKPFEKGEWLNRLVTYNATRRVYEKGLREHYAAKGLPFRWADAPGAIMRGFKTDAETILSNTQFTANLMSTPAVLQGGHPMMGNLLANPLSRMFLSFPTRTLTSLLTTSRAMAGGRRELFGREVALGDVPFLGAVLPGAYDMMRMMGFGAILYEGVGAFGMDMRRGVAPYVQAESLGLAMPGGEEGEVRLGVPLAPALNIPVSFVKGLMQKDADMVRSAMYRLVPGGMGLQRLAGVLPDLPGDGWAGNVLQKRYADWGAIQPDGTIPIRDMTGRMVEQPNALEMVMRGIGFDFSRVGGQQELMAYMQKNRERYQEAKWRALRALRAGDVAGSRFIQEDFTRTTGIPLRVSRADLDRYLKNADQTMPERMWGTLPVAVKDALRLGPLPMPPATEDALVPGPTGSGGIPGPFGAP